ncbi:uncharacterized protein LOC118556732 [Fundulus heteroclitus]|uniref:uncharacterized protein LOC118556732 n=1 Tax=Fundulus heteroclitus TaxID=8078 RepID=UPI00165BE9E0|nr:uncharacterized protein LOC118556732 [Fundulus heteroclitus]
MQQTTRRQTVFTMRVLIFLCVFGWAVAATNGMTFDCNRCTIFLEGSNKTKPNTTDAVAPKRSNTTTNSSTVPGQNSSITVQLNATDAVALNASDTTTNSSTTNEGDAQTERSKRDTEKPYNSWHGLTGPGFNPEENDSQLNGTDVDPQNGSNNTTSSSTFQVSSTAKPRTRAKPTQKPSSSWHPLKQGCQTYGPRAASGPPNNLVRPCV